MTEDIGVPPGQFMQRGVLCVVDMRLGDGMNDGTGWCKHGVVAHRIEVE